MVLEELPETLEYTPTWVVAAVCTIIVTISLFAERFLHHLGKVLKRKKHDALYEALQKLKEELMLLGFISLLLTAVQNLIGKICVHPSVSSFMLPCKIDEGSHKKDMHNNVHRLLSGSAKSNTCAEKGKASLLSLEALHHLHIFIFVLAAVHVGFCAFTMALGSAKIRKWKHWEESIRKEIVDNEHNEQHESVQLEAHCEFVRDRALGIWKGSISWILSFLKQFYASVTKSDYTALRSGFVARHCGANKIFNFYKYMMRTLEDDFKVVVGISWYLWLFAVIFLLLNLEGWHIYFWLSFLPLTLLLFVNTKLEHVITRLAHETLKSQEAHVKPSDHHFWFRRPGIILYLIHFILFQNSFELAFVFTIWILYGFHSCIMGQVGYIIPRLVIGVIVQVLCSYSTLPLYAIVTQMGDSFKQAIFADQLQSTLHNWAETARRKKKPGSSTSLVKSLNVFGSKKNEVAMQNVTSETPTISQNDQKPEENAV